MSSEEREKILAGIDTLFLEQEIATRKAKKAKEQLEKKVNRAMIGVLFWTVAKRGGSEVPNVFVVEFWYSKPYVNGDFVTNWSFDFRTNEERVSFLKEYCSNLPEKSTFYAMNGYAI